MTTLPLILLGMLGCRHKERTIEFVSPGFQGALAVNQEELMEIPGRIGLSDLRGKCERIYGKPLVLKEIPFSIRGDGASTPMFIDAQDHLRIMMVDQDGVEIDYKVVSEVDENISKFIISVAK